MIVPVDAGLFVLTPSGNERVSIWVCTVTTQRVVGTHITPTPQQSGRRVGPRRRCTRRGHRRGRSRGVLRQTRPGRQDVHLRRCRETVGMARARGALTSRSHRCARWRGGVHPRGRPCEPSGSWGSAGPAGSPR